MSPREESSIAFVLELGRALHAYGTPAHRLEDALGTIGRRLGMNLNIFSTPTSIMISFGPSERQHTSLLRVEPGDVDLEKLALVDQLAQQVECGELAPAAGREKLQEIVERPARYGSFVITAAFALVSASAARFFGGGLGEIALAFGVGLMIGFQALMLSRTQRGERIFPLVAAFSAALASGLFARFVAPVSTYVATLAGLIVLIPGLTLTVAMNELATRNLVSGSSRLTAAGIVFLEIAFGVALGEKVVLLTGEMAPVTPAMLPFWTEIPALLVAALALTVLFRARPWGLPFILVACTLSIWGARGGTWLLGPQLGVLVGAFLVGGASNIYSRLSHRPAAEPMIPGILLLVPGSLGFQSIFSFLGGDTASGLDTAFSMVMVALAIVAGLLVANAVIPARKAL